MHINTLDQLVVTYELSSTGEHAVSQWFYYGPDGKVIVLSPELPATITVALGPEDSVLAGATGTVKAGSIRVSYRAVAPDTVITASDICIQNLNATPVLP
ncbi:MAG: hypothetical protein IPM52_12400 [Bacteroidetes bacterium]|nr:hypothetical protein [Bacteroidota bacterium]